MNNPPVKNLDICLVFDLDFYIWRNVLPRGVAKKAASGDDLTTPVDKNPFGSDGGKGCFAKGSAKAQVTEILFSNEAIIHFVIVTAEALFDQHLAPLRPFLARALPNSSPSTAFLTILAIFALGGDNPTQPAGVFLPTLAKKPSNEAIHPRATDTLRSEKQNSTPLSSGRVS